MWSFFLLTLLLAAVPLVSAEDHHQVLLWPEGRVCYHINTSSLPLARVAVIEQALRHVEQRTNLTFCAVSSECGDCPAFVHFEAKDGCWSYLGRQDPARLETSPLRPYTGQTLSVGVQCTFGHVLHELGHSLGLRHTHSRPDRDRYVRVFRENVEVPAVDDFEKVPTMPIFGAYDYHSIMHYGLFAHSKNGRATIVPVDAQGRMSLRTIPGQRQGLSQGDIHDIESLYASEFELRGTSGSEGSASADLEGW